MTRPSEFEHIEWMRRRLAADPRVHVGVGDDCAVVRHSGDLLVTTDMLLEGVHFTWETATPTQVGRKAMNVNLSDIAAMAGEPLAAVVAVGLPASGPPNLEVELFEGLNSAAAAFNVPIVGGDTNKSRGGLVIAVTLFGTPTGAGPVLRSGGKPGDVLFVTGRLGYSLGGRHLDFIPRICEAQVLHREYRLTAMMDLSDGLGSDLFHLTRESGCGAAVDASALPIHDPIGPAASDGRSATWHAINDGEDFELLFAVDPDDALRLERDRPLAEFGVEVSRIGVLTASPEVLLSEGSVVRPFPRGGFVHQWDVASGGAEP